MRIMVFDVPAQSGGALTILKQYYETAINDCNNEWFFVISTPELIGKNNVTIIKYPWVKKSWFHRLFFDKAIAHKLVKNYKIDEIISLQNILISNIKIKQTLYLHQPLPFINIRFSFFKNRTYWIYQNIISKSIYKSVKKADKVIVQTEWMRDACLKKIKTDYSKFTVQQPEINIHINKKFEQGNDVIFFYPASGTLYKNHNIIVEAAKKLKECNISNYRIVFTLDEEDNYYVKNLHASIKENNLPFEFIGQISLNKVYEYYSKSILLFPSYIETFGLPLLEAKMHGCPIIASDCEFSHEILDDYDKVKYFNPFNYNELYNSMIEFLRV